MSDKYEASKYKWLVRPLLNFIPKKKGPTALTLHHIDQQKFSWLSATLDRLLKDYEFIDPGSINKKDCLKADEKKKLLLTFDDGFLCNKYIAEEILEPRGIKALFFITKGFMGLKDEKALAFVKRNFYPDSTPDKLHLGSYDALSVADIKDLSKAGHTIGAHTETHPKLSRISEEQMNFEVISSSDALQKELDIEIKQFAYPFGSMESINEEAFIKARENFDIAYSNIRGMLSESPSTHFLYRENIVPGMPIWLVEAIVEGRLDWLYRGDRKKSLVFV